MNFLIKTCAFLFFLRHGAISYLIDYSKSVNITLLGSGKPRHPCDFLNLNIRSPVVSWNQTKSPRGLPATVLLLFSRPVVSDSATPWSAACQASLFSISWSLLRLKSFESVMPSNHLILCCPLLLPPSIFATIRVFSSESALCIMWPKYWSECVIHCVWISRISAMTFSESVCELERSAHVVFSASHLINLDFQIT